MKPTPTNAGRYIIEAVSRACDILEAFSSGGEALRLCDITARTGLSKATAFRILFTLEQRGLVEQGERHTYRLRLPTLNRRKYRFGYGAQTSEFAFSRSVSESIEAAALAEGFLDAHPERCHHREVVKREQKSLLARIEIDMLVPGPGRHAENIVLAPIEAGPANHRIAVPLRHVVNNIAGVAMRPRVPAGF